MPHVSCCYVYLRYKLTALALKLRSGSTIFLTDFCFHFFLFPWKSLLHYIYIHTLCSAHNALFIKFCLHFHVMHIEWWIISRFHLTMENTFSFSCHSYFEKCKMGECAWFAIIVSAQLVRQLNETTMHCRKKKSACHLHELKSKLIIIIIIIARYEILLAIRNITSFWGHQKISLLSFNRKPYWRPIVRTTNLQI